MDNITQIQSISSAQIMYPVIWIVLIVGMLYLIYAALSRYYISQGNQFPVVTKIEDEIQHVVSLEPQSEVFNISENVYRYQDAAPVCAAFGAQLATINQVHDAYKNGADWCNYGWIDGQMAVYPTQKDTWEKLQAGSKEQRDNCGLPGVNGGHFDNPDLLFGVNCFGIKPPQKPFDKSGTMNIPRSSEQIEFDNRVAEYKSKLATIGILPFQPKSWAS